jgi:tetratricopeptide (TPR) repeat protein
MKRLGVSTVLFLLYLAARGVPLEAIQVEAGGKCLRGCVFSDKSGSGSRIDVLVTMRGRTHVEQANTVLGGMFTFCNLPAGDYVLEATASGHEFWQTSLPDWPDHGFDSSITIVLKPTAQPAALTGSRSVSVKTLTTPRQAVKENERFLRYAAKGDWGKSMNSLEKAIAACPDCMEAWINKGTVLVNLNRGPEAEAAFRRAIEIAPEMAAAHRKLGYLYLTEGKFPEARSSLARAAELDPLDARTQVYIGRAFNESGDTMEAEKHLKRALDLEPDMSLALYHLGFVHLGLNQPLEALDYFERCLKRGIACPASDELRAIVDRLRAPSN